MRKLVWLLCPVIGCFMACDENANASDFLAGEQFTGSNVRVMLIDTLTVSTSTMKFDSINTTESSRILLGKYSDVVFGEVKASSYFEMLPDSYTISSEALYDSVVFYLTPDSYYYNDTLQYNGIHVKRLAEQLKPSNGDLFYNTSTTDYFEEDLGFLQYKPRPLAGDSLGIRLEDGFGMALFEQLQKKLITNQDQFTAYLNGITLQPGETDNGSIIGFSYTSESTYMRIYFSTPNVDETVQSSLSLRINRANSPIPFFNQILSKTADTYLEPLEIGKDFLPSAATNEQTFIQAGIGIATRMQFPSVKTIYDLPGKGTILGVSLKIKPGPGTYNAQVPIRDNLNVYVVDRNNNLVGQLEVSEAILNRPEEAYGDIYYEIDLSTYLDQLLLAQGETGESLILLPSDYNSTVDRFILNGGAHKDFRTTLELTYAIYDEKD